MADRIRGCRASTFRRSGRKLSVWAGAASITPSTVATNTVVVVELVPEATLNAIGFEGHVARTRGLIVGGPATAAQDPMVSFGVGVFPSGLVTAANFPDPRSTL